ncbi:MAG: zinc-ribbon domain-containing protein [Clostridia bacterium]|nr:zinc-ribbon domain-containing protein [Clostridia bacterium]
MKCISCGNEVPNDVKFCRVCGMPNRAAFEPWTISGEELEQAEPARFCMGCGAPLTAGAAFCSRCGRPVAPIQAKPAAPVKEQNAAAAQNTRPVSPAAGPATAQSSSAAVPKQTPVQAEEPVRETAPVRQPSVREAGFMGLGEYLIDEKVSAFKFENAYTVYDGAGNPAGAIRQVNISGGAKAARVLLGGSAKAMQSFQFDILDNAGRKLASIKRGGMGGGIAALRSIQILDASDRPAGRIQIVPGWTPKLQILDASENPVGLITGDWKGWNFTIQNTDGKQIGAIDKKWNGFGKEFFTSADKYHVTVDTEIRPDQKMLITAAAVTVDMVMHEMR